MEMFIDILLDAAIDCVKIGFIFRNGKHITDGEG